MMLVRSITKQRTAAVSARRCARGAGRRCLDVHRGDRALRNARSLTLLRREQCGGRHQHLRGGFCVV